MNKNSNNSSGTSPKAKNTSQNNSFLKRATTDVKGILKKAA
jgi:hypothetical protein